MRVVLDTNVLLAALISSHSPPDIIYRAWLARRFDLVTGKAQLDELRRVSCYPKIKAILPAHRVGTMINNIQHAIVLDTLPPLPNGINADDPNDAFLLSMSLAGKADYLVTGDRRAGLLQRGSIGCKRIVTPDTVEAILAGDQPRQLNLQTLCGRHDLLPRDWEEQRKLLGFSA